MKLNVDLIELTAAAAKITEGKVFPYDQGSDAYFAGKAASDNPYDKNSNYDDHSAWSAGWVEANEGLVSR